MPQEKNLQENKMGALPVGRLLLSMSVPMMLSMMVQALYNIIDSIFVSMISESALTAVSLAFPIQSLMISCSVGLAVGINAYLSKALGEQNFERVNKSAANGIFLEFSVMILFVLTGLFLTVPFFRAQTSDPEILHYGQQYMRIICCCSLGIFMEITFERILQSTGKTIYAMATQMVGAIFNICMDPILIFGLFGAPKLGATGVAIATAASRLIELAACVIVSFLSKDVKLNLTFMFCDLLEYMPAPDFSTGGEIVYRREEMERIVNTGTGSFQIRSRWRYLPDERIIEVYEIPYTTKTDVIIERIVKLSKEGKVREIADIRDETDLSGLRIAIDLKRGVDPEQLMAKLFRSTTLQDSFACNFNVLVDGYPRVMGVREILHEWVAWRVESTRRRMNFDLAKKTDRLHLLHGLEAILLDIDKAIAIIRGTKLEADVVPNLMKGFGIDQVQAEFVAEIKLRNINEEYIMNRTRDIEKLEGDIAELNDILASEKKIKDVIHDELAAVNKKYVMPRKTGLVEPSEIVEVNLEPEVEEYPVTMMLSRDGYLKKMTDRVLRKAATLKYKDGDEPFIEFDSSNTHDLLVFTNHCQVYKCKVAAFDDTKSAQLGSYLPTDLEMDDGEVVTWVIDPEDYKADALFVFENGRVARVALSGYATKTNRKRLKNAIYGGAKLLYAQVLKEDRDLALVSSDHRLVNFNTSLLRTKTTNSTQGVQALTVKGSRTVAMVGKAEEFLGGEASLEKFRAQSLPSAGAPMKDTDMRSLFD